MRLGYLTSQQSLIFPTSLSVPLSLWTKEILPKHGSLVQKLTVKMSAEVLAVPWHSSFQTDFHDNTYSLWLIPTTGQQPISPQGMTSMVEQCPNIVELVLQFPSIGYDCNNDLSSDHEDHHRNTYSYVLNMSPLISGLAKLRHLGLEDYADCPVACRAEQVIIPLISCLPLLESLSCKGFRRIESDYEAKSLAIHVSQLEHLSRIDLCYNRFPDKFWLQVPWSGLLTDVSLVGTGLSITELNLLVHKLAPNLNKLKCAFDTYIGEFEGQQSWLDKNLFNLPRLANLTVDLEDRTAKFISAFRDCKALQRLTYISRYDPPSCSMLLDFLSRNFWPLLTFIKIQNTEHYIIPPQELVKMEQYCKRAKIQLVVEMCC